MSVKLYLDEDSLRQALVEALRQRGVDVTTPLDAGMMQVPDPEQLEYATTQGRSIYTFNMSDFCRLHSEWLAVQREHAGIIVARQQQFSVGEQLRRLLKLNATRSSDEMRNRLEFLSDWD